VGANHFCRMLCVWLYSRIFKVPPVSLFNMGMCFLQCVFSIQMQYNIQSAIYTSRNCLHILIRPWLEIAAVRLFCLFTPVSWKAIVTCSCPLPSPLPPPNPPPPTLCVELLVNVYCNVLNLNSWLKKCR